MCYTHTIPLHYILLLCISTPLQEINKNLLDYKTLHETFDAWLLIAVEAACTDSRTNIVTDTDTNSEKNSEKNSEMKNEKNSEKNSLQCDGIEKSAAEATKAADKTEIQRYSFNAPAGRDAVFQWRLQAERGMKIGLTDDQVADFVSRFMPAYVTYLPSLYASGPQRRCVPVPVPVLKVTVDIDRFPISAEHI